MEVITIVFSLLFLLSVSAIAIINVTVIALPLLLSSQLLLLLPLILSEALVLSVTV